MFERDAYRGSGERSCDRNYTRGWRKGAALTSARANTVKVGENLIRRCTRHGYDGLIRVVTVTRPERGFDGESEGSSFTFIFVGRDGVTKATNRVHTGSIPQSGKVYYRARLSHAKADKAARRVPGRKKAADLLKAAARALARGL
jgi:hypothetical protein